MPTQSKKINPGGINGTGKGVVNTNSQDYVGLKEAILAHAGKQSPEQKRTYALLGLKYQMETYASKMPEAIIPVGVFLKKHLKAIDVTNKAFAKFIEVEESNLSAIINGRRKVNVDLAIKLGQVFDSNPNLWLLVQSKNEIMDIAKKRKRNYAKYTLDGLLKRTR